MRPFAGRNQVLVGLPLRCPRKVGASGLVLVVASALLLSYLAWPYAVLWRIDQAARSGDMVALANLVNLASVRAEIKKKLNKDADSTIGELSNSFIRWLEEGIAVMGSQAVDRLVTLSWVRTRLLSHGTDSGEGFWGQIDYAFFDAPGGFIARIGPASDTPVLLRLSLRGLEWRISAVYY
jgi:hypothetical protein